MAFERLEDRTLLASFTVNADGSAGDADFADGACDADLDTPGAQCTFAAALDSAQDGDSIFFDIEGGVVNFSPAIAKVERSITIDGADPNDPDNRVRFNGGIVLFASGSTVQNMIVFGSIFTDSSDSTIKGNRLEGGGIFVTGTHVLIENNTILDSPGHGIQLGDSTFDIELTTDVEILSNFVGIDPETGQVRGPATGKNGIHISGLRHKIVGNTVGGSYAGIVLLTDGPNGEVGGEHHVYFNAVGTDFSGSLDLGNSIGIGVGGRDNKIGTTEAGFGNIVAFNAIAGVVSFGGPDSEDFHNSALGNSIRGNSIFNNGGLGIDLQFLGVTENDEQDADTGPNNVQNYPVLTALPNGDIEGTLNSTPGKRFEIDFYSNDPVDPSEELEGQTYLGTISVMTDGSGNSPKFLMPFPVGPGKLVTATATDESGNTSEFSLAARRNVFVVNSKGDDEDKSQTDGRCDTGETVFVSGKEVPEEVPECTLRAAIQQANETLTPAFIHFNIAGPSIIAGDELPVIEAPVLIDGTTDPDYSGSPVIIVDGAGTEGIGFDIDADSTTLKGLVIRGFSLFGVDVGSSGVQIESSEIVSNGAGIRIANDFLSPRFVTIGGNSGNGNVIADNLVGIYLTQTAENSIEGNFIGTDRDGARRGNRNGGITILDSSDNVIGGSPEAMNTIRFNGVGISMIAERHDSNGNQIVNNSISDNVRLGIDLVDVIDEFVVPNRVNDLEDRDEGPNRLQNFPDILSAANDMQDPDNPDDDQVVIRGALRGLLLLTYQLEFFASTNCHRSQFGEGEISLGTVPLEVMEIDGIEEFLVTSADLVRYPLPGQYITATATDSEGNTSEFSRCVLVNDVDGDGQLEEAGVDGNGDGTDDSTQGHVTTFETLLNQQAMLVAVAGLQLTLAGAIENPSPSDVPAATFPIGFLNFGVTNVAPGASTTVDLLLPSGVTANTYFMYGPTLDDPNPHWFEFAFDGTTGAEINGGVVKLHFIDGGRGDLDLTADGEILDPGGPAMVTVVNLLPWQNTQNPRDSDGDGSVSPLDALVIINRLNSFGSKVLPTPNGQFAPPPYYDVDGDGSVSPIDVLLIINFLNNPNGEGENTPIATDNHRHGLPFEFWSNLASQHVADDFVDGRHTNRSAATRAVNQSQTRTGPLLSGRNVLQPNLTSSQAKPEAEWGRRRAAAVTELLSSLESQLVDEVFSTLAG